MRIILILSFIAAVTCCKNETVGVHRVTHVVWFEITVGTEKLLDRIEIGLFGKVVPVTVQNFVNLATKPKGQGYKGSKIYFIGTNMIAGGQWFKEGDQMKGRSSYDNPEFDDENHVIKNYGAGWVSSDPYGKDGHTSLFFITLRKMTELDESPCVVFGKVIFGMPIVRAISRLPTNDGIPVKDVVISDCGAELADPPFFELRIDATE